MSSGPTAEQLQRIGSAEDDHDDCPVCGEEYEDVDMTQAGNLYFIHDLNPGDITVSGCEWKNDPEGGA
jgi:hypothetical protein